MSGPRRSEARRAPALGALLLALGPLSIAACSSPREPERAAEGPASPLPVAGPWTDEFLKPAVLIADVVEIEGPAGLLAHVATRPVPGEHERIERTLAEGFEQEIRVLGPGSSEIKVWLDRLEIVALQRVRVLERVAADEVLVRARGDVFWQPVGGAGERRAPTLELRGALRSAPVTAPEPTAPAPATNGPAPAERGDPAPPGR